MASPIANREGSESDGHRQYICVLADGNILFCGDATKNIKMIRPGKAGERIGGGYAGTHAGAIAPDHRPGAVGEQIIRKSADATHQLALTIRATVTFADRNIIGYIAASRQRGTGDRDRGGCIC